MNQQQLIFLISQPRAGSTLLQSMLNGHSQVDSAPEPWLLFSPLYVLKDEHRTPDFGHRGWRLALEDFLARVPDGREVYDQHMRQLALALYSKALTAPDHYFLDKTPRYFLMFDDVVRLFPQARYLVLLRNPLAVLMSMVATFPHTQHVCVRHGSDLLDGPRCIVNALRNHGDRVLTVKYEDLVLAPQPELARICQYLEMPYEAGMEAYGNHRVPQGKVGDPNVHQHDRPHTQSLDKWKQMVTSKERAQLCLSYLSQLGDQTVTAMGYDVQALRDEVQAIAGGLPSEYTWRDRVGRIAKGGLEVLRKVVTPHRRYHTAWG